ncbi:MAG: ABC transporter permease [Caldilineaceae bacterium]|jgi:peptide/nickel transport system permease protein|nr:ABC transporter permease [Caldilineaceae bacterium]
MSTQISERSKSSVTGSAPFLDEAEDRSLGSLDERLEAADERFYYANPWQLILWRFRRHRLAMLSLVLLVLLYLGAIFAEFVSPYSATWRAQGLQMMPPTSIHIFHEGSLHRPFVYGLEKTLDQETFKYVFTEDASAPYPILFFTQGEEYKMWGLWPMRIHLFGTGEGAPPIMLFGSDELGRDIFSRTIYGSRISLSIGLFGVLISFLLGVMIGGVSGYFGGTTDEVIQRLIDVLISIPLIPFWMALSAALPRTWDATQTFFAITLILAAVGWTGLARVVRGKLLALREEDYALAAQVAGASKSRIIFRHLMPGFTSHLIVSITLAIPVAILGETALSFLGLGIQPPAVSWGVLLKDAQDLVAVAQQPWRLIPALFVIGTVLLFNFVGDGLRDAADPYSA